MSRSEGIITKVLGIKGINQQERLADPILELADANNLWAPNGRLEKRPGFYGASGYSSLTQPGTGATILKEDPIGTFSATSTLDSLPAGSRWYIGMPTLSGNTSDCGLSVTMNANINLNNNTARIEYWNGRLWAPISHLEVGSDGAAIPITDTTAVTSHLSTTKAYTLFYFAVPFDLTLSTINAVSAYWFRLTVQSKLGDASLDASVQVPVAGWLPGAYDPADAERAFMFRTAPEFPNGPRHILMEAYPLQGTTTFINSASITGPRGAVFQRNFADTDVPSLRYPGYSQPPCVTVVPEFDEAYIAYNYVTTVHKANPLSAADVVSIAVEERDPLFVGADSSYDPDFISQGGQPEARFITYHRGEMWAANLKGSPLQIRWSAGTSLSTPGYKIWPTISTEFLADVDQGQITGLMPWQDSVVVFKSDSIWQMVYTGQNALGLNTYRPEKIVSGTGCVSNASIQNINGTLVFLSENGVYQFDGNSVVKLSDRVQSYVNSIVPGRRRWAVSAHWKAKSCYLLSICSNLAKTGALNAFSDGNNNGDNNTILVWDYKNDSWWVWTGITATGFLSVDNKSEDQVVYFYNAFGTVYTLGVGLNDYGAAIESYGITQRINQDNVNQKLRAAVFLGSNTTKALTIECQTNDKPFLDADTTTIDFTDKAEKTYGIAQYNADEYTVMRDRFVGVGELKSGEWFRLKFSHDEKDAPLSISEMRISVIPTGARN